MFISDKQRKELGFAKVMGVIDVTDENHLVELMNKKNDMLNEYSYGKTSYNEISFLRYILYVFRMKFVFEELDYGYKEITEEDIIKYYEEHKIEFFRENREYFPLEEVRLVIKKRIRELEYEEIINGLLY